MTQREAESLPTHAHIIKVGTNPALETDELIDSAQEKLRRKGCDLIVANLAGDSIGKDNSIAYILDGDGVIDSPGRLEKAALAERILDHVVDRLEMAQP